MKTKGKKEEKILVVNDLEIKPTVGRYEIVREIGKLQERGYKPADIARKTDTNP